MPNGAGRADEREARAAGRLAAGFLALVALTWALIVLGALVRAHGAGLACPDWPLCFGELVPSFDLKVAFEWGHRATAGGVSLAFAVLAALALRREPTRRATARLLGLAAALLALQILFGALTVWHLLASWSVTAHLLTGTSFALVLLLVACALRELAAPRAHGAPVTATRVRALGVAGLLLTLQLGLGGLVSSRYAGLACPAWPACNEAGWLPTLAGSVGLHLLHRYNGYAVLLALLAAAAACRGDAGLARITAVALGLGAAQVTVGVANVLLEIPVELTALHSALATALVMALTLALREVALRARARA